jgi:transposase
VPMLEGKADHVIGVDTHRDRHAAAILDRNGGVVAELEIESDQAGCEQLLDLAIVRAPGRRCWALEGTGCYGADLASFLLDHGKWVVEVDRPKRPRGRTGAKSDPLDAIRAGRGLEPRPSRLPNGSVASARRYECCSLPAPGRSR